MVLLTNGDSWTQGDSPSQTFNWEATKTLDWYYVVPNFGDSMTPSGDYLDGTLILKENKIPCTRQRYKFYDSKLWPKELGRKLGIETWNAGRLGSSNDNIVRTTISSIDYLESIGKKDLFVVIGLTSMLRYETWNQNEKKQFIWEDKRISKNEWLEENERLGKSLIHRACLNIINLQSFLKTKNIPYLIFNCFDAFFDRDIRLDPLFKHIDLDYIYNNNFEPHFKNHIEKKFNTHWGNNDEYFSKGHPKDISHIEWGNHLNEYIQSNYTI